MKTATFRSGALLASAILAVTVGVTVSTWTSAEITNTTSSAAVVQAALLREVSGPNTCNSYDASSNGSTCSSINKYGGTAAVMSPGQSQTVDVTFRNVGTLGGSTFGLNPGPCTQSPAANPPTVADLCTDGDLTVSISCSPGATYNAATAWTDLVYSAAAPPTATRTHPAVAGDLDVGAQWTCRIVTSIIPTASNNAQGITPSQALTWTLS